MSKLFVSNSMNLHQTQNTAIIVGIITLVVLAFFLGRYRGENENLRKALAKANANIEGANDVIRDAKSWGIGRTDEEGRALNGLEEVETVPTP